MADEPTPQVTTRHPYRLTEKSFYDSIIRPAGTVLHLLPHEVTPTMEKLAVEDMLAVSLKGAVCQSVASPIAGFLPLNIGNQVGAPHQVAFAQPRRLRLSSTADLSGIMLVLFGIDESGTPFSASGQGPGSAETPYTETTEEFRVVTGLMASGPVTGLTIDALETQEEARVRLDAQSERHRLLWEKSPRTPAEAHEVEALLARRHELAGMDKRTPDEEEELRRLVADLPAPAEEPVETPVEEPVEEPAADPAPNPSDPAPLLLEGADPVSHETPPPAEES